MDSTCTIHVYIYIFLFIFCFVSLLFRWLSSKRVEFDVQSKLLSFIISLSILHTALLKEGRFNI